MTNRIFALALAIAGALLAAPVSVYAQACSGVPNANQVCASPNGSAGFPSFRALVGADLPPGVAANVLNTISLPYTVQTTDCGKTLQATATGTLTIPAVTGFASNCIVKVVNTSTTTGVVLSGQPAPWGVELYPTQGGEIAIVNGAWASLAAPGLWTPPNVLTIYVDPNVTGTTPTTDGLSSGTAVSPARAALMLANEIFAANNITLQYTDRVWTDNPFVSIGYNGPGSVTISGNGASAPAVGHYQCSAQTVLACFNVNQANGAQGGGNYTIQGFAIGAAAQNGAFGIFVQGANQRVFYQDNLFLGGPQWTHIGGQFSSNVISGGGNKHRGGGSYLVQSVDAWRIHITGGSDAMDNPAITVNTGTPCSISLTNHGLSAGTPIGVHGTVGTGVSADTLYYVIGAGMTANSFEFSTTQGGAAVNCSGSFSGDTLEPAFITDLLDGHGQGLIGTSCGTNLSGNAVGKKYNLALLSLFDSAGTFASCPGTSAGSPASATDSNSLD